MANIPESPRFFEADRICHGDLIPDRLSPLHSHPRARPNRFPGFRLGGALIAAAALLAGGCVVVQFERSRSESRIRPEAIDFLNQPGVTYADVVANLGPPAWESESRTLAAYTWSRHTKLHYLLYTPSIPHQVPEMEIEVGNPDPITKRWALLLAFDGEQRLKLHEIRVVEDVASLADEAAKPWAGKSHVP